MTTIEHPRLAWWREANAASLRAGGPVMPLGPACAALDRGLSAEAAGREFAARALAPAAA